jgi:hypothetical protein
VLVLKLIFGTVPPVITGAAGVSAAGMLLAAIRAEETVEACVVAEERSTER